MLDTRAHQSPRSRYCRCEFSLTTWRRCPARAEPKPNFTGSSPIPPLQISSLSLLIAPLLFVFLSACQSRLSRQLGRSHHSSRHPSNLTAQTLDPSDAERRWHKMMRITAVHNAPGHSKYALLSHQSHRNADHVISACTSLLSIPNAFLKHQHGFVCLFAHLFISTKRNNDVNESLLNPFYPIVSFFKISTYLYSFLIVFS